MSWFSSLLKRPMPSVANEVMRHLKHMSPLISSSCSCTQCWSPQLTSQSMARADLHNSSLLAAPLLAACLPDVIDDEDSPRVRMATRHLTRLTGNDPGAPNTSSFLKSDLPSSQHHYHSCIMCHVTVIITVVTWLHPSVSLAWRAWWPEPSQLCCQDPDLETGQSGDGGWPGWLHWHLRGFWQGTCEPIRGQWYWYEPIRGQHYLTTLRLATLRSSEPEVSGSLRHIITSLSLRPSSRSLIANIFVWKWGKN